MVYVPPKENHKYSSPTTNILIRNIFYTRQAMNFNVCRATQENHQHQNTSDKYFPDKEMVSNRCMPFPGHPRKTSGNLLSVQFTPLVSRAMMISYEKTQIIVSIILDRRDRGGSVKREQNSRSPNAKRWGYF